MTPRKVTVICTTNQKTKEEFNFAVNGWHTEEKMEKLTDKYANGNLLYDYIQMMENEYVNVSIHKKF